jgi:hypothetical protein
MNEQILSRHGVIVIRFVILPLLRHPEVYVLVNPFLGRLLQIHILSELCAVRILLLEYLLWVNRVHLPGLVVPCGAKVPQEA